jgi:hypothetical protein
MVMHCKLVHDTRNALAAIIGQCELGLQHLPANDPGAVRLGRIASLAWQVAHSVDGHQCQVAAALHREITNRLRGCESQADSSAGPDAALAGPRHRQR